MARRIDDFKLFGNKRITEDLFIMEFEGNELLSEFKPGQFVQVKINGPSSFLRRPISIHDVDYNLNTFKLLILRAGQNTAMLAEMVPGDSLNMIYPLGNSFSDPAAGDRVLLVGGGVGVAPLLFLAKRLISIGYKPDWLLGFRSGERIIDLEEYKSIGEVYLTTEDGSVGERGYVTGHSVLEGKGYNRIYCCGPDPMMKAISDYCKRNGITCEVSLENLMACGIGICLCCVVCTVKGHVCTCTEGPIFNITDLKW